MSKPVTILVIDDDYDTRSAVKECLLSTDMNPTVLLAHNALVGIQMAKEYVPDVVVLDLIMPLGSGFDFVNELKRDPKLSRVRILILTSLATTDNVWRSIDGDVDDFLAKPFDIIELEGRVRMLINKERAGSSTI